jgi:hypothetical protein
MLPSALLDGVPALPPVNVCKELATRVCSAAVAASFELASEVLLLAVLEAPEPVRFANNCWNAVVKLDSTLDEEEVELSPAPISVPSTWLSVVCATKFCSAATVVEVDVVADEAVLAALAVMAAGDPETALIDIMIRAPWMVVPVYRRVPANLEKNLEGLLTQRPRERRALGLLPR